MSQTETKQQETLDTLKVFESDTLAFVKKSVELFEGQLIIASSFSAEDVVLIDLYSQVFPEVPVLALDTGRLPEETYKLADVINNRMNITLKWLFPEQKDVEALLDKQGQYGFYQSLENRHDCCQVRKVKVLTKGLQNFTTWVTGQRREQSVTRSELQVVESETHFDPDYKLNPLAHWSTQDVWNHIKERGLPVHPYYSQGYTSIGCAPCTRAITPGDHERAGRWWWEDPEHKECGLHAAPSSKGAPK